MVGYSFAKLILNTSKFGEEIALLPLSKSKYSYFTLKGDIIDIFYTSNLSQDEINEIGSFINNFVEISVQDQMEQYLSKDIEVFIKELLLEIRAQNILMGVTQMNKTTELQGFFEAPLILPSRTRAVSLKGILDTASLTVALEALQYLIQNPLLYSDLNPFITSVRLTEWYNRISIKLSLPTI